MSDDYEIFGFGKSRNYGLKLHPPHCGEDFVVVAVGLPVPVKIVGNESQVVGLCVALRHFCECCGLRRA
jgi:hypothetical protein